MKLPTKTLLAALVALSAATAQAELYDAWVSAVESGDTLRIILRSQERKTLRIAGIDAPEQGQDFSAESAKALSDLILNKVVLVQIDDHAPPSRLPAAQIAVSGQDVGLALIEQGYAWLDKEDKALLSVDWYYAYESAQDKAIRTLSGMWSRGNPVPPWIWRKFYKKEREAVIDTPSNVRGNSEASQDDAFNSRLVRWFLKISKWLSDALKW